MTDNETTNLSIAKSQAVLLANIIYQETTNLSMDSYTEIYKKAVSMFLKANNEIDAEVSAPTKTFSDTKTFNQEGKTPSPRQKYCEKCKLIIPATWTTHRECGWNC